MGMSKFVTRLTRIEGWYLELGLHELGSQLTIYMVPVDGTTLRAFDAQGRGQCVWNQN